MKTIKKLVTVLSLVLNCVMQPSDNSLGEIFLQNSIVPLTGLIIGTQHLSSKLRYPSLLCTAALGTYIDYQNSFLPHAVSENRIKFLKHVVKNSLLVIGGYCVGDCWKPLINLRV